ncbi:MAG: two-component regulator propeller domain-containing protein [Pseudomonadota bacterium]
MRFPRHPYFRQVGGSVALALICAALFAAGPAHALDPRKAVTQYVHDAWLTEDGLPQDSIQTMVQTADGYLWLGTQEGLVRFDGVKFVVFDKTNTKAFTVNNIEALAEGKDGTLWIGTSGGGLIRYNKGSFKAFGRIEGLASDRVLSLLETGEGELWIGTDAGLSLMKAGRISNAPSVGGPSGALINDMLQDRGGTVWVATRGKGIFRFEQGRFTGLTTADGLASNTVLELYEDRTGVVWIGTEGGGLNQYSGGKVGAHGIPGLALETVEAVFEDSDGSLWIGTWYAGLVRARDGTFERFSSAEGLSHDRVEQLLEDREGSLWIATNGGLNRLRDAVFTSFGTREGLASADTWSVYQDSRGRLWVGTEKGLELLQGGKAVDFPGREAFSGEAVLSIMEDREGVLWTGTHGGGIKIREEDGLTAITAAHGLADDIVYTLVEDKDGAVWAGTNGGLSRIEGGTITTFTESEGLPHYNVRALHIDGQGTLWAGTEGGGVATFNGAAFSAFDLGISLTPTQKIVHDMYEEPDGTLWMATVGGLIRYGGGSAFAFTTAHGLFDDNIYRILEDGEGNLWMSCNKGIFRASKLDLARVARGEIRSFVSVSYGRAHGMPRAECNGGAQPAGWKTSDGRLWFPTVSGVVTIDPSAMEANPVPPPVLIEKVIVADKAYNAWEKQVFPPGTRKFEFQYTAPAFLGPEQVMFRHMLGGMDAQWSAAGANRSAYYHHLPPGEYEFRVTACNSDGAWNEEGASFAFVLKPYFYEAPAFIILCIFFVAGLILSLPLLRIRRLRARERELTIAVEKRTAELREMAEELKEMSLMDPLTRLRNRRFLFEVAPGFMKNIDRQRSEGIEEGKDRRGEQGRSVMGVFMIDIDHFKNINDTYGHDAGDRVLKQFAGVLMECKRAEDIIVRWGGEEFLVVLPRTLYPYLRTFADRVREQVEARRFEIPAGKAVRVTCSVGFCSYPFLPDPGADLDLEQVISVADLGLYTAKKEGRNRVIHVLPGERVPKGKEDVASMLASLHWALERKFLQIER